MNRPAFIAGLGGAAAWSVVALGQQQSHRIAFVHSGIPAGQLTETAGPFWIRRFYEVLRGLGDVEGVNLVIDRYSAETVPIDLSPLPLRLSHKRQMS
jgi:putative tryptophan/tyrosine transport system substrate-binding protein